MATVRSHFHNFTEARDAMILLKSKGFTNVYLDAAGNNNEEFAGEINPLGSSEGPSLSALILRSAGIRHEIDKGPLLAAHPAVSGMGTSHEGWHLLETNLIVHVDEEKLNEIRQILTKAGGKQY